MGSGKNKITYYVADVYTSNINCFRTYFGQNTYGTGYTEYLTSMSRDVHSILAMNGDSYCYNRQHTAGVLIRNGTLYRAEPTTSDVCILYKNGEMKTYSPDQFDLQQAMQDRAYQTWTFGLNQLVNHPYKSSHQIVDCLIVFEVLDWYNPYMNFLELNISTILMIIFCFLSLVQSARMIFCERKLSELSYKKEKTDKKNRVRSKKANQKRNIH